MSDNPSVDAKSPILPEFHFDLVARILPGLTAIFYYSPPFEIATMGPTQVILATAAAYVLGLFLDAVAHYCIDGPFMFCSQFLKYPTIMDLWHGTLRVSGSQRRLMLKIIAERALFRSLLLISLVNIIIAVFQITPVRLTLFLSVCVTLLLIVPFVFFHWIAVYNLSNLPPSDDVTSA